MTEEQMQRAAFENTHVSVEEYMRGERYADAKNSREQIGLFLLGCAFGVTLGAIIANLI